MKTSITLGGVLLAAAAQFAFAQGPAGDRDIRHGRYLVQTSGCNDCHTPGYMQKDGDVPESEWLTGDAMGWHGPWGTTYPANLRRLFSQLSEKDWLIRARQPMRPPMPSPSLRAMSDADLRAIYRYVRSLELKGPAAPAYVPPGGSVATPYLDLTPKNLPVVAGK